MRDPGAIPASPPATVVDAPRDRTAGAVVLVAAAVASGFALECALGGYGWSLAAWVAPVPLLLAIRRSPTPVAAYAVSWIAGLVFFALDVRWVFPLPGMDPARYAICIATLATLFGGFGPLAWWSRRAPAGTRWLAVASAWSVVEYARLHVGFASIPWGVLAYSQVDTPPIAQLASAGGPYAVSFAIVAVAASLAEGAERLRQRALPRGSESFELLGPPVVLLLAGLWGAQRLTGEVPGDRSVRVALVQAGTYRPGTDPRDRRREILDAYRALTRQAAAEDVDLVVWPASSAPGAIPFDSGIVRALEALASETATPVLVGSSGQDKAAPVAREAPTANSAYLFDPSGRIRDYYDKIRLLPFNEYLPLRSVLHWPDWLAQNVVDASAGRRRTVFEIPAGRFGTLICWENLFADGFRSAAGEGLDFVVSQTNEAFTTSPTGRRQMLDMNRMRAIENGLPVVRVATTGTTAAINRWGGLSAVVTDAAGATDGVSGYRIAGLTIGGQQSFYSRHGDWFVAVCAVGGALLVACGVLRTGPSRTS